MPLIKLSYIACLVGLQCTKAVHDFCYETRELQTDVQRQVMHSVRKSGTKPFTISKCVILESILGALMPYTGVFLSRASTALDSICWCVPFNLRSYKWIGSRSSFATWHFYS